MPFFVHKSFMYSFADKLFRRLSCTALIRTKVGIKPLNQIIKSDWLNEVTIIKNLIDLEFDRLTPFPDFLKDKYTLIDTSVSEWPHYDLIRCLDNNLPLNDCEYIKRRENGTLDFRKKFSISKDRLRKVYQKKITAMANDEVFSVKIFLIDNDSYIVADGKHSLAMSVYFKYPNINFELIQNLAFDTYFRWIFDKIKNDKNFTRHSAFFRRAYQYKKKETDKIRETWFNKESK